MSLEETWRPIPGYEGRYDVSDLGRVRSWVAPPARRPGPLPLILRLSRTGKRYVAASLVPAEGGRNRTLAIHRLVLLAFVGPRPSGMAIRHLDGDPTNNRLSNLTYGTNTENNLDVVRHGRHPSSLKTHCPQGHPYDERNTLIRAGRGGRPSRVCRACSKQQRRARQNARAAL